MKNKLLLVATFMLTLASCGSQTKRDSLIFYVWGDASEIACYEKIANDFTNETGIKVSVQPSTGEYYDNLNISFSSKNNAPDIFFTESGEFLSHLASDKLLNLTPYINDGTIDVKTANNNDGNIELWDINDAYRYDGNQIGKGD